MYVAIAARALESFQDANKTFQNVADAAARRLTSRYTGAAYQFLIRQTAGWPRLNGSARSARRTGWVRWDRPSRS